MTKVWVAHTGWATRPERLVHFPEPWQVALVGAIYAGHHN